MGGIVVVILLIGGQIAGAYYLFTQTSASDGPPSARSARTKAIIGCCVPVYGIPFAAYFFWKFKSEAGQDRSFRQATGGAPTTGGNPFGTGSAPSAPAVQQANPFASDEPSGPAARPTGSGANPFATDDQPTSAPAAENPFTTGDAPPPKPSDNPFM